MKKLFFLLIAFVFFINVSIAADYTIDRVYGVLENTYVHQSDIANFARARKAKNLYNMSNKDMVVSKILEKIKELPDGEPYEILMGNNPTKKPIIIQFKNLSEFNDVYKDFDALGWKAKDRLYIFVNNNHKDAPYEALVALIAGRTYNLDEKDSINEEIYCWASEAYAWEYFIRKNPKLKEDKNSLVERENEINKMLTKGKYAEEYVKKAILLNKGYTSYAHISEGYSDEELEQKLDRLKKIYNYNTEENN